MAYTAITTNPHFVRECFVIWMTQMPESHSGENKRKALLNQLSKFSFNKKKIHCNYYFKLEYFTVLQAFVCVEGSNLVRLFTQIDFSIEEFKINEYLEDEKIKNKF